MIQSNKEQIKQSFHNEMVLIYKRITKELKHKSPRLIDLINKHGGYEAAIKYLVTESAVQDFAVLWENQRLDLSVEALIVNEKYRDIFDEAIVKTCDKKLQEYSYAPLKIEEPVEEVIYYEDYKEPESIANLNEKNEEISKPLYQFCEHDVAITVDMWKEAVVNTQLVSSKNLDLLIRIYLIGDDVTPEDLCKEEGYTATYPYNDVVSAMAKRIKAYFKIDVPMDSKHKPLWWHLIFIGGLRDSKCFEWSLRTNLRIAMQELIEAGTLCVEKINVSTHRNVVPRQEMVLKKNDTFGETKEVIKQKEDSSISDFDKLFESIMGISAPEEKNIKSEDNIIAEEKVQKECSTINTDDKNILEENINTKSIEQKDVENKECTDKERIKKECIDYYGAICDICGFDYGYTYGEEYELEIEVHNIKGHTEDDEISSNSDPIKDLIPICRNCHHMLHKPNSSISVEDLRGMIKA